MKAFCRCFAVLVCLATASPLAAADEKPALAPQLEPLRPFLDKTWSGSFKNSTPERPIVDIKRWERALNGKAVRVLHSVNGGAYGGETIFMWNEAKKTVEYHYFTTAGFTTVGTMSFKDGKMITHEVVSGSAGGATEVRGTSELLENGTLHVSTELLVNGEWKPGHEVTYKEDPTAKVVFK